MNEIVFGKTSLRVLQLFLLVVLVCLFVLAFGSKTEKPSTSRARILFSKAQVGSLVQGVILFAWNNADQLPTQEQWPDALLELGIIDTEILVSRVEDGDGVSFIYVPGPYSFDETQILIYEDPKHWKEGVIVGFADAHAEIVPHEEFERMLAEQLALQVDGP